MKINIQSVGFTASQQLLDFVEQKVGKLSRFEEQIESAEVQLRVENAAEDRKVAEIRLLVRGEDPYASKNGASFEEAVDECVEALRRQLLKRKGKLRGN